MSVGYRAFPLAPVRSRSLPFAPVRFRSSPFALRPPPAGRPEGARMLTRPMGLDFGAPERRQGQRAVMFRPSASSVVPTRCMDLDICALWELLEAPWKAMESRQGLRDRGFRTIWNLLETLFVAFGCVSVILAHPPFIRAHFMFILEPLRSEPEPPTDLLSLKNNGRLRN